MKEQFCTYGISLKLKELGFKNEVLGAYLDDGYEVKLHIGYGGVSTSYPTEFKCKAPLWQQAQDFFRKKYNLHIEFYYLPLSKKWGAETYRLDENILGESIDLISTYQEAREKAILKAIEICKNN